MPLTSAADAPALSPRRRRQLERGRHLAAASVAVVAAMTLLGWALDNDVLKSVLPGHSPMKANTALALLLCTLALGLCDRPGLPARWVTVLASLATLLFGVSALLQYGSGVDFGIDTWLFADPEALAAGLPPGRMSEISAMAFVMLGWRGLDTPRPEASFIAQALALAVVAISLFALSAYGYAMGTGSREAPFSPVSVHTAVSLLLLGAGWLATQPDRGLIRVLGADTFGGELARRTLLPALLAPALLSYLSQQLRAHELLSEGATITLLALSSGVAVVAMMWWASALLDRLERQRRDARTLQDHANTDALTGLGNRRAFDSALAAQIARRQSGGPCFSLLLLDLDHFKSYNDAYGHPAGDEALNQAGLLLRLALRPGDLACRHGGEEFAVLLPGAEGHNALRVAERIVFEVRSGLWTHRPVTVSVGVAEVRAGDDATSLVERADAALYAAKRAGRDRAVLAGAGRGSEPQP